MDIQEEKKEWKSGSADCKDTAEDRLIDQEKDLETALLEDLEDNNDNDNNNLEDRELVDLPKELRRLKDQIFGFQDELEAELVKHGFLDLPVVIDPKSRKACLRMTSGAHDKVTNMYTQLFNKNWGDNVWGVAVDGSTNVFIQALPSHKETRRKPDIAFWGRDKCELNKLALLMPKHLANPPKIFVTAQQIERVNPDVVFQFSWENSKGYDIDAINDMMNKAIVSYMPHQPNNEAPKLGFLLKVRFKGKKRDLKGRKILQCLNIYQIPHGATYKDAKANRKGASHSVYEPGGQDVVMEITAQDLCLGNYQGAPGNPYKISAKVIFDSLL